MGLPIRFREESMGGKFYVHSYSAGWVLCTQLLGLPPMLASRNLIGSPFSNPTLSPPSTSLTLSHNPQRGWTTWTTGAVDKRVIGIVPIVMDLLNIRTVSQLAGHVQWNLFNSKKTISVYRNTSCTVLKRLSA